MGLSLKGFFNPYEQVKNTVGFVKNIVDPKKGTGQVGSRSETGFDTLEVSKFMQAGQTLTTVPDGVGGFTLNKPQLKERKIEITKTKTGSTFDMFFNTNGVDTTETVTGFGGDFSSLNQDQIDALTTSYLQRYNEIKRRRGQFGTAGLSLARA